MLRRLVPAAGHERALVGLAAMLADLHFGEIFGEHAQLLGDPAGQAGLRRLGLRGDVPSNEQVGQVGIDARAVEVHHLDANDLEPASPQDVQLDGHVGEMLVLEPGGRLHLDQAETAGLPLQDVDRGVHAVREERRLVEDRHVPVEQLPRHRGPIAERVVRKIHELASRHVGPGHLPHPRALIEDRLLREVGDELGRVGLVHLPPQQLVALESGREPGLGEPEGFVHRGRASPTGAPIRRCSGSLRQVARRNRR